MIRHTVERYETFCNMEFLESTSKKNKNTRGQNGKVSVV